MQNRTARARTRDSARQLRRRVAAQAGPHLHAASVPREQTLAVWRLEHTSRANPLPRQLARATIVHYTERGDLVLAPNLRGGELLQAAAALGRRALPLAPSAAIAEVESVVPLRSSGRAALVLAPLGARASERRLAQVAARLLPLLRPGGFLALARGRRDERSDALGHVVRACQESGLQYWQHVVALALNVAAGEASGARAQPARKCGRPTEDRRAVRCHHDLLVFRRPADANVVQTTVAAVEPVAA